MTSLQHNSFGKWHQFGDVRNNRYLKLRVFVQSCQEVYYCLNNLVAHTGNFIRSDNIVNINNKNHQQPTHNSQETRSSLCAFQMHEWPSELSHAQVNDEFQPYRIKHKATSPLMQGRGCLAEPMILVSPAVQHTPNTRLAELWTHQELSVWNMASERKQLLILFWL